MQQNFERITQTPRTATGLASIRDTGIPVYRVVRLAAAGHSTAAIIDLYPELEPEDVLQALAYAMQQLQATILFWRNEGLMPLANIKGYADLIVSDQYGFGEPGDKQDRALSIINADAARALACWDYLVDWARTYQEPPLLWHEGVSLRALVEEIQHHVERYAPQKSVENRLPNDLPTVRDQGSLRLAIVYLLTAEGLPTFAPEPVHSIITARRQNDSVLVEIHRITEPEMQAYYAEISPDHFYELGLPWATAALILHAHGSALDTRFTRDGITFRFTLPVWSSSPAEGNGGSK